MLGDRSWSGWLSLEQNADDAAEATLFSLIWVRCRWNQQHRDCLTERMEVKVKVTKAMLVSRLATEAKVGRAKHGQDTRADSGTTLGAHY